MKKLTPGPLATLLETGRIKKYPKGQLVLYEGDETHYLYYLKKGTIKAYDIDANGNEKIINLVSRGDYFPLLAIFEENGKIATFYSTITECEIVVVPREKFIELLCQDAEVGLYLLRWFTERVKSLVLRMSSLEKTDTTEKLRAILEVLAKWHSKDKPSGWKRVNFPVNQQLLADMAGVTRESLNTAFNEAKAAGAVRNPRSRILEIDPKALEKLN